MPQRTWLARPAFTSQRSRTGPPRQSAPAPPVPADDWSDDLATGGSGTGQAPRARSLVTARSAALVMLALFLAGDLLADRLSLSILGGLSFVAGCLLAAVCTQRHDLLLMVTMPPLIFLIAVVCVEVLTSPGSTFAASAGAVVAGTILTLSAAAPWLFGGVLLCLIVAMFRGLPQCVRDLRLDLRGQGAATDRLGQRER
jgi:hypothetical protein